jgi:NADH-quinone oxidoreductase subunit N
MGKFALLKAALSKGHLALVILAVINSAIAVYYYLGIVREAVFRDPEARPAIALNWASRTLCVVLIAGIVLLGIAPGSLLDHISASYAGIAKPPATITVVSPP